MDPGRELIYKGPMKRRGGSSADSGDLQLFLFDHALLMVKQKTKHEQLKVIRRVRRPVFRMCELSDIVMLLADPARAARRFVSGRPAHAAKSGK